MSPVHSSYGKTPARRPQTERAGRELEASAVKSRQPSKNALVLAEVQRLLELQKPGRALEAIGATSAGDLALANAKAVCLMRVGRAQAAVHLLRPLVLQAGCVTVRLDVPRHVLLNLATALLLDGNVTGSRSLLAMVAPDDPDRERLENAINTWFRSLSICGRLNWYLGGNPKKPPTLDFPPGLLGEDRKPSPALPAMSSNETDALTSSS